MSQGGAPVQFGLRDTSVFIAEETGRQLAPLPEYVAISVVTVGELHLGVENAADASVRARRAQTLSRAKESDPIALSESTMIVWARLVAACRRAGVHRQVKIADALIAACAVDNGLAVVTRDGDVDAMAAVFEELDVLHVGNIAVGALLRSVLVVVIEAGQPRGEALDRHFEVWVEVDELTQPFGQPRQGDGLVTST